MAKSKALITGVTGMVGSHMADFLLQNTDWDVYGACRWRSPMENVEHLLDRANRKDRVSFVYADLNDFASLMTALEKSEPDYIFHLAGQSYPKTSFDSPEETLNTNILGTTRLLEAVRKMDMDPTIHVCSSSEVFGKVPRERVPIGEDERFHPASPYAISKAGVDLVGRFYAEAYGMKVMTTRMFTHTGPRRGDVFAESTFAKQIAMIERGMLPPVIKVGNLDSVRTWADVRDAVRAYYMLVTINPTPGQYYNIGGDYTCTVGKMLEYLMGQSSAKNIAVETDSERIRPLDADVQIPNTEKFRKHTGWNPAIPFEKTMGDLLEYWRQKTANGRVFLSR